MFLSQEIDIKLYQNYTKTYIYKILHKSCSIQQIRNQSENQDIPEKPNCNLSFIQLLFLFLIDIIDNIIF